MREHGASSAQSNSVFSFVASHKRTTLVVVSAVAVVGVGATYVQATSSTQPNANQQVQQAPAKEQIGTSGPSGNTQEAGASSTTQADTTSTGNSNTVRVQVNGKDIPVPANGTVSQTVPDGSGQPSSVTVTNTSNGGAQNNSSTSLNVSVNSTSTTSGASFSNQSTFVSQNGGSTTVISTP